MKEILDIIGKAMLKEIDLTDMDIKTIKMEKMEKVIELEMTEVKTKIQDTGH